MKSNLPRGGSELAYRVRNSASAQMWITVAVAITFALAMRNLYGTAFGYAGGFLIFIVAGGWVLYADLKRRRSSPVRVKDKSTADEAHDFGAALFQERLADDDK